MKIYWSILKIEFRQLNSQLTTRNIFFNPELVSRNPKHFFNPQPESRNA